MSGPLVIVMGAFPPPVMGLAVANEAMLHALEDEGAQTLRLDTAPRGPAFLPRAMRVLGARLPVLGRMAVLALTCRKAAVYCGLSHGAGQAFDLAALLLARLRGFPVTLHHHGYLYLDRPSALSRLLFRVLGHSSRHIVLSEAMAARLRDVYPDAANVRVLSNAALIDITRRTEAPDAPLRTLGFLGHVSCEKGADRFVDLLDLLRGRGLALDALVAGSIADDAAARKVKDAEARGVLRYLGPVSGDGKVRFFGAADVVVLPSRYPNEAEPLVLHEAMAAALPVIASARGCIPSLVMPGTGCLLDRDAADLTPAVEMIEHWVRDPGAFRSARATALAHETSLAAIGQADLDSILAEILSDARA
jgi:glycosyltransferase involved in cell wall biosynthesis